MDSRVREHARILVDHCTDVSSDDDVLIRAPASAEALVVALYEQLGERGARPSVSWLNQRASRAYHRAMDSDDYRAKEHDLAAMKETDVAILVGGVTNAAEMSDVDPRSGRLPGEHASRSSTSDSTSDGSSPNTRRPQTHRRPR